MRCGIGKLLIYGMEQRAFSNPKNRILTFQKKTGTKKKEISHPHHHLIEGRLSSWEGMSAFQFCVNRFRKSVSESTMRQANTLKRV